jgi:hypothetical protein
VKDYLEIVAISFFIVIVIFLTTGVRISVNGKNYDLKVQALHEESK